MAKSKNLKILKYWNNKDIESMYDKYLLNAEIRLISQRLSPDSKILDAGCGECEGTLQYSKIKGVIIDAADFSDTRLKKAKQRLQSKSNVHLINVDFLGKYCLDHDYDYIISQRFLINLLEWKFQRKVLLDFMNMIKPTGYLILLEGCIDGVKQLNDFRKKFGLKPIPVKWHNLFFDNKKLVNFMRLHKFELIDEDGLGEIFLLTRGIRPIFDNKLNWNHSFNKIVCKSKYMKLLNLKDKFSRLKLWVFQKNENKVKY